MKQEVSADFIRRRLTEAGFWLEEANDLIPKIQRHLPDNIDITHDFFHFAKAVKSLTDKGMKDHEARLYIEKNPSYLFSLHNLEFKPKAQAAAQPHRRILPSFHRVIGLDEKRPPQQPPAPPESAPKTGPIAHKGKQVKIVPPIVIDFDDLTDALKQTLAVGPAKINDEIKFGNFKGKTWEDVNTLLKKYASQNPACGFTNLPSFIGKHSLNNTSGHKSQHPRPQPARPQFTSPATLLQQRPVVQMARNLARPKAAGAGKKPKVIDFDDLLMALRQTVETQSVRLGEKVEFGAFKGTKWANVNAALTRHAKSHPDCGFYSLASFMVKHEIENPSARKKKDKITTGTRRSAKSINFDDLLNSLRQTVETKSVRLGEKVEFGEFKDTKWSNVNSALVRYAKSHPDCGFTSLSTFMKRSGIENPTAKKRKEAKPVVIRQPLDLDDLAAAIRQTLQDTGKNIKFGEIVQYGKLTGIKWVSVNSRLTNYAIKHSDCGFNSLSSFMKDRGIEKLSTKKSKVKEKRIRLPLDFDDLASAIQKTIEKTGKNIQLGSINEYGKLAGTKWSTINSRLFAYHKSHRDCDFNSISSFIYKQGIAKPPRAEKIIRTAKEPLTCRLIFNTASEVFAESGIVPSLADPDGMIGNLKISRLNRAFTKASLPDLGDYTLPGQPSPKSLQEFLLVAGVVKIENQKLVPAVVTMHAAPMVA